jgi:hypothetical protein
MAEKTSKMDLRPIEVGVGAAAAVITAFATSYLGTAGTLTGAALASIVGTVSTSALRTSAERTNESLQRTTARLRQTMAGPEMRGGSTAVDPGVAAVDEAELAAAGVPAAGPDGTPDATPDATPDGTPGGTLDGTPDGGRDDQPAGPGRSRRPGWLVLAGGAVAAFVVALVAITGIESAIGKPLAALIGNEQGGGTSISRTITSDPAPATKQDTTPTTPTPSTTGESQSPSQSPSPTGETSPAEAPTATPTGEPTVGPSVTEPAPTTAAPTP